MTENLSFKKLTLKSPMIAALVTAARSFSIHKMELNFRFYKCNGVLFKVLKLTKCSRPNKPSQDLSLVSFLPEKRLRFVTYLKHYEKITKN